MLYFSTTRADIIRLNYCSMNLPHVLEYKIMEVLLLLVFNKKESNKIKETN